MFEKKFNLIYFLTHKYLFLLKAEKVIYTASNTSMTGRHLAPPLRAQLPLRAAGVQRFAFPKPSRRAFPPQARTKPALGESIFPCAAPRNAPLSASAGRRQWPPSPAN